MSVDLKHASLEGADQIGIFKDYDAEHNVPPGWSRGVINKIMSDSGSGTVGDASAMGFDRSQYTADELAAYDWYTRQTEPDRWKDLVFEYESGDGAKKVDPPADLGSKTDWIDKPAHGFQDPNLKPFSGSGGTGSVVVSTEAITYFANALGTIAPNGGGMLLETAAQVLTADPRPGGFAKAELMRRAVVGTSATEEGLRGETNSLLIKIQTALYTMQECLRQLVKEYDSAEELNGLTVAQFRDVMSVSDGKIDAFATTGGKEKSATGG